jgi:hypothetical protein
MTTLYTLWRAIIIFLGIVWVSRCWKPASEAIIEARLCRRSVALPNLTVVGMKEGTSREDLRISCYTNSYAVSQV